MSGSQVNSREFAEHSSAVEPEGAGTSRAYTPRVNHRAAKPSAGSRIGGGSAASMEPSFTVMIVDDVQDIRDLYERFFEIEGARVITAEDGVSALQVVLFQRPDIIILDLAMPRVTGTDVIGSLKGDPRTRTIPILVVSGQHDARRIALDAG